MPTKQELSKFSIRGFVTESAANTFTEQTINTNLAVEGNSIFVVTGCHLFLKTSILAASTDQAEMQLAYASQSDILQIDDPDWLCGRAASLIMTTSGAQVTEMYTYQPVEYFPLAQAQLFLGVKGTNAPSALTAGFKLEGYLQKVTTTDFFRITRVR